MTDKLDIRPVKGMPDVLPEQVINWQYLEQLLRDLMNEYGYEEIRFPVLERTELFKRSIGDVTDIVEKEMFSFSDRDKHNTSLTLRPEGTIGCVRAAIEHGLLRNKQQQRLWYMGPMFRRENPQKGRYRQFFQLGVETFGLPGPDIDIEQILMMRRLWERLGLIDSVRLEVNTLGNSDERTEYKKHLVKYFREHYEQLDEDSKRRLETNPLRILDSKNPELDEIISNAPKLMDFLGEESKGHFSEFIARLKALKINFTVNDRLVRGLDYYNLTVYEWVTDKIGSQATVCAGGRYDPLVEQLGGGSTFGVGFAAGLERILLLLQTKENNVFKKLDGYLICIGEDAEKENITLAEEIRNLCPTLRLLTHCGGGNYKNQFKKADKSGAKLAIIVGDDELAAKTVTIKYLRDKVEQQTIPLADLGTFLRR